MFLRSPKGSHKNAGLVCYPPHPFLSPPLRRRPAHARQPHAGNRNLKIRLEKFWGWFEKWFLGVKMDFGRV